VSEACPYCRTSDRTRQTTDTGRVRAWSCDHCGTDWAYTVPDTRAAVLLTTDLGAAARSTRCPQPEGRRVAGQGGAFDSLGHPHKGLYLVHAEAVDVVMDAKRAEATGQFDLFRGGPGTGPG
jgi:hypothetical protein